MKSLLASLACSLVSIAHAASSAQALTPLNVSVLGGETKTFSVRFLDAAGRAAAGESVQFVNDACGWFGAGSAVASARTDANGVASVDFTAYNQGITCWLIANAGAQVQFNVLTYTSAQVYMTASLDPLKPAPGQPYKITSSVMAGLYKLYDQNMSVRVVPGTAGATISPGSANTGEAGSVVYQVTPDNRVGDYDVEFTWRGKTQKLAMKAPANPWKDMWWAGSAENGWGMSVVQHGDVLFNVIYGYDASGQATWYAMPGGTWNAAKTIYAGSLYRPKGSPFSAYDASKLSVGDAMGSATLSFLDGNTIALDYVVEGVTARRILTRQPFGPQETPALATDNADMWWGGAAQNGWGVALLQQYRTVFGIWFTYDANGNATWLVMPSGYWSDASTYEGRIFRTTGSPLLGARYDATAFRYTDVGPFKLHFSSDGTARLDYSVDGRAGFLALSRQPF